MAQAFRYNDFLTLSKGFLNEKPFSRRSIIITVQQMFNETRFCMWRQVDVMGVSQTESNGRCFNACYFTFYMNVETFYVLDKL